MEQEEAPRSKVCRSRGMDEKGLTEIKEEENKVHFERYNNENVRTILLLRYPH